MVRAFTGAQRRPFYSSFWTRACAMNFNCLAASDKPKKRRSCWLRRELYEHRRNYSQHGTKLLAQLTPQIILINSPVPRARAWKSALCARGNVRHTPTFKSLAPSRMSASCFAGILFLCCLPDLIGLNRTQRDKCLIPTFQYFSSNLMKTPKI